MSFSAMMEWLLGDSQPHRSLHCSTRRSYFAGLLLGLGCLYRLMPLTANQTTSILSRELEANDLIFRCCYADFYIIPQIWPLHTVPTHIIYITWQRDMPPAGSGHVPQDVRRAIGRYACSHCPLNFDSAVEALTSFCSQWTGNALAQGP